MQIETSTRPIDWQSGFIQTQESNNPQPCDPPVNSGGDGGTSSSEPEEPNAEEPHGDGNGGKD